MNCKNEFCVYQFDGKCSINKEISINHLGMCSSYLQTDINRILLVQAKDKHLKAIEDRRRYLGL